MTLVCDICGYRGHDVRPGVVAWIDGAQPYNAVDRCTDHAACRARVESDGEVWPVVDWAVMIESGQGEPTEGSRFDAGPPADSSPVTAPPSTGAPQQPLWPSRQGG